MEPRLLEVKNGNLVQVSGEFDGYPSSSYPRSTVIRKSLSKFIVRRLILEEKNDGGE